MNTYNISFFISDTTGCSCCGDHHDGHAHSHVHEDSAPKIEAKIKSFGAWAQVLPESFVVKSELTAQEMYDEINEVCNKGDLIFINKIDCNDVAYANPALVEWLK